MISPFWYGVFETVCQAVLRPSTCLVTHLASQAVLQVILKPFLVWNDRYSNPAALGAPGPDQPPTASPPVLSLEGGLEFRVYNNATTSMASPTLSMHPSQ